MASSRTPLTTPTILNILYLFGVTAWYLQNFPWEDRGNQLVSPLLAENAALEMLDKMRLSFDEIGLAYTANNLCYARSNTAPGLYRVVVSSSLFNDLTSENLTKLVSYIQRIKDDCELAPGVSSIPPQHTLMDGSNNTVLLGYNDCLTFTTSLLESINPPNRLQRYQTDAAASVAALGLMSQSSSQDTNIMSSQENNLDSQDSTMISSNNSNRDSQDTNIIDSQESDMMVDNESISHSQDTNPDSQHSEHALRP
jgi:hypothetical protein